MSKKISWSQFKVKDSQTNVSNSSIENFQPYGFGKNHIKNWNFKSDDLSEFIGGNAATIKIKDNNLLAVADHESNTLTASSVIARPNESDTISLGKYIFRARVKSSVGSTRLYYRPRHEEGVKDRTQKGFVFEANEWKVVEIEVDRTVKDSFDLYIYLNNSTKEIEYGDWLEIDWIQFTPKDKQHLAINRTPIPHNLTRIQCWGGDRDAKLSYKIMHDELGKMCSFYIKNMSDESMGVRWEGNWPSATRIPPQSEMFVFGKLNRNTQIASSGTKTDFIASDLQIVEGEEPNPVLVVKELDNGREHVKVYGATPETTLVYDEAGFKGELYSFETTIENEGTYMNMKSTIGDYNEEIKDGVTEIKHEGNLRTPRIEIELGASDE